MMKNFLAVLACLTISMNSAAAAEPVDNAPVDYQKQIKPILAERCFACHGALKQESGLRLDAASLLLQGGDDGPAIVAGKPAESLLWRRITAKDADDRMPPEGEPLTAVQIATFKTWITQGAKAPDEAIPADPRKHWAYQAPRRPTLPKLRNPDWVRNAIDAMIAARHEKLGLKPVAAASKEVLLRRVFIDLIGLPPTRDDLRSFLADDSPKAFEKVVDRLLDSPQHGERWGRHWMDIWRYSDWAGWGAKIRYGQRHLWRWRDWIIESINADKGYDRMIVEMIAGDESAPGDPNVVRATGFLARNWYKFDRNTWLDDTIEHTAKAFLGMTIQCARCHDHKYDPISQKEYYRFRAIFEPYNVRTDPVPGQQDLNKDGLARVYDAKPKDPTFLYLGGDPKRPDKEHPLTPGVPSIVRGPSFEIGLVTLPPESFYPALQPDVYHALANQLQAKVNEAKASLAKADKNQIALAKKSIASAQAKLTALEARIAAERAKYAQKPLVAKASRKNNAKTPAAKTDQQSLALAAGKAVRAAALAVAEEDLLRSEQQLDRARSVGKAGDAKNKKAAAAAEKKLAAAKKKVDAARQAIAKGKDNATYPPLGPTYPRTSTGRRLALARWIADRRNPLTARVAVNHIWLRHFGAPLVENVVDFGLRSSRPPHADLLDFLAVELMDHGWSMKKLHRLIVTSATYRMASSTKHAAPRNLALDLDNLQLWRMNSRRIEAEAVRDSILQAAGNLDTTRGGPVIDHRQGQKSRRRSVYFRHARQKQMKFLEMFDAANPRECYRRKESIRPQQAFAMVNTSLALAQSRLLARRLCRTAGKKEGESEPKMSEEDFVVAAFETVLSRSPSKVELGACRKFLLLQSRQLSDPSKLQLLNNAANAVPAATDPVMRARENFVLVLFSHNDFVTIR